MHDEPPEIVQQGAGEDLLSFHSFSHRQTARGGGGGGGGGGEVPEVEAGHRLDRLGQAAGQYHVAHHGQPKPDRGFVDSGNLATAAEFC
ncbi:hypothetical protein K6U67_09360 [Vibrio diabolicus]|nr:hypothetical protein [Vibrio diabolicus]MCG6220848.1 hypothetical protein [Vibrio diabolicus]